jgi:myo-inositol-1(or 4)-monophosphatase
MTARAQNRYNLMDEDAPMELPSAASGASALDIARDAAALAQEIIREHFRRATVTAKGNRNVVTEADVAVERAVTALLQREFPGHAILAEEEGTGGWSDGWMWVCDPIDGTKNFSQGIPHFAFSLALCHGGKPVLGLTTHPLLGWEFAAWKDGGCWFNGTLTSVSTKGKLSDAVFAIDLGYDNAAGLAQLDLVRASWPAPQSVRVSGSAALGFAYVAAGLWDVYVHGDLNAWDVAAGIVLVEEAGGVITRRDGGPVSLQSRTAIAGTPGVHRDVTAIARG